MHTIERPQKNMVLQLALYFLLLHMHCTIPISHHIMSNHSYFTSEDKFFQLMSSDIPWSFHLQHHCADNFPQ
jgi:hypothetical protein